MTDSDGDGYPADQDCDDSDENIYPGVQRDCQSDCSTGTETCLLDGTWSTCTASTDCDCTNPGDTRLIDCGNCGQASQECGLDLKWGSTGPCLNQGECSPGASDTVSCQFCGTGTRLCDNTCTWGAPDCFGSCSPGDTETTSTGCTGQYELQQRECSSQCAWQTTSACTPNCLVQPRAGNSDFKDELCVPGGPFIMGCDLGSTDCSAHEAPAHTVELLPFLMDTYEVTIARYRECVQAGVCSAPTQDSLYWTPGTDSQPVNEVTYDQAVTFCFWDGGRRLPTEAQWEKAARGPSPRTVLDPWGSAAADCTLTSAFECLYNGSQVPHPVNSHPAGISYFGFHELAGNLREWVRDFYDAAYYVTSPLFEPEGPTTSTVRAVRGYDFRVHLADFVGSVNQRLGWDPADPEIDTGFRCSRAGY